jgi:hypothetical protein
MDKATRTFLVLALPLVVLLGPGSRPSDAVPIRPGITVQGATSEELSLARWAVGRYDRAGLVLPPLQIFFHDDASGCQGHTGLYTSVGRVDLCPGLLINAMTRKTILHEMGHGWSEVRLSDDDRTAFMALRNLDNWESYSELWDHRGWEQAAEIIAWGVGERILTPTIPEDSPEDLAVAYQLLTDTPLPSP